MTTTACLPECQKSDNSEIRKWLYHAPLCPNGPREWFRVQEHDPPVNQEIETKIDDAKGVRNVQILCRMKGNSLWWTPDGSMYVYYAPTHWRFL